MQQLMKIWMQPIHANQEMIRDRKKGEQLFEALLRQHPKDGMEIEKVDLAECIRRIEASGIRADVHQTMRELKRLGNKAVHQTKEAATDFSKVPDQWLECAQWIAGELQNLSERFVRR